MAVITCFLQPTKKKKEMKTKQLNINILTNTPKQNAKLQDFKPKLTRVRCASLKKSSFFFCPKTKRAKQKEYFLVCPCIFAPQPVAYRHYV